MDQRYYYTAKVARIVDGDTLDLFVDLGFGVWRSMRVRLFGIDTPETYSVKRDSDEYRAGMAAKARVAELTPEGSEVWIHSRKTGKFGRYVVLVWGDPGLVGDVKGTLNHALWYEGHATLYKNDPLHPDA